MSDCPQVRLDIEQGAVVVNDGILYRSGPDVVAILVDMKTKRADVGSIGRDDGVPDLLLHPNEYTLYADESKGSQWTRVAFPDYKGWSVLCANVVKYTLSVCLTRD